MFKVLIIWNVCLTLIVLLLVMVVDNLSDEVDELWDMKQVDIYRHAIGRYFNHD